MGDSVMSLRDQLLKTGLATKEQAKKANREAKQRQHQALQNLRKQNETSPSEAEMKLQEMREADIARNQLLNEERRQKEELARAIDIMVNNDLCDPRAEIPYAFVIHEKRIATIRINELQIPQLASGQIAIAAFDPEFRFFLVSEENAGKIRSCRSDLIVCHHKGAGASASQAQVQALAQAQTQAPTHAQA